MDVDGTIYDLGRLRNIYGEDAYIVQTRSGGFHVYCNLDERVKEWRNRSGINGYLDIRSEGGFVVGGNSPGYEVVNGNICILTSVPDEMFYLVETTKGKAKGTSRLTKNQKQQIVRDENDTLVKALEAKGFTNVKFNSPSCPYNFDCDQVGMECPLGCGNTHTSNHYCIFEGNEGDLFVKNWSERCTARLLNSYDVVKLMFERAVCRINNKLIYPDQRDGELRDKKQLCERYQEWTFVDGEGKEQGFIHAWLCDKNKRQYRRMDFFPEDCPDDCYNTFSDYDVKNIDKKIGEQGGIQPFLDLTDALCDGETKYVLDYCALLYQKPGTKPRTALVFKGREGDGKNHWSNTHKALMGKKLYCETNNSSQDVYGTNATAYNSKKLVVMNESEAKLNFQNCGRLKSLITDVDGVKINPKYVNHYDIRNLAGTIIFTNEKVPVVIGKNDRRFVPFTTNSKYNNNQAFFANYREWLDQEENQRALYDFFMSRDISGVDWVKDRPTHTRTYQELRNSCLPQILKWLEYFITEDYPINANGYFKATELKMKYEYFNTKPERITDAGFGSQMSRMVEEFNIPEHLLKKVRQKDGNYWALNRGGLFKWLKEEGYTSCPNLPASINDELVRSACGNCGECPNCPNNVEPWDA